MRGIVPSAQLEQFDKMMAMVDCGMCIKRLVIQRSASTHPNVDVVLSSLGS